MFNKQFSNSARTAHYLQVSLPSVNDYDATMPSLEGVNEPRRIFFLFLDLDMVLRNSTQRRVRLHLTK